MREIGLSTPTPAAFFGPNCSGACTTTSGDFSGTVITVLHLGQGPFLPANFSLTLNRVLQPEQKTSIGITARILKNAPDHPHPFRRFGIPLSTTHQFGRLVARVKNRPGRPARRHSRDMVHLTVE